jgi:aminoglycoside 3-N-acetyltransferase I
MSLSVPVSIRQLASDDVAQMEAMLTTFGEAFDEVETYGAARPILLKNSAEPSLVFRV